ncbi:DUF4232 domain-containing protein [Streptomyces sp. SP18CS02]|uniref:DUF4232 domain-containing protein n=1 Tax=Streptomyces sp. SP18CS02 TaxID=3002531 RepID=UPI002E7A86E2|nr:DUF4232 domain-containing protein [Streptomyces sp. SP18CS02]MEE1751393.1 DUF4232 domain-containing protein [Streptomyces sp. SP18CS02]
MRTTIRRPAALVATAVATLSLTLTACGGGDAKAEGAARTAPSPKATVAKKPATAPGQADSTGSGDAGADPVAPATQTGAKKKAGGSAARTCTVDDVNISAAKQEGVPTTHLTLTATNVSGSACTLLQYPLIAFGDVPQTAKDVPPVAKSKPAGPIVLNAGTPAYAAVRINEGGVDEETHVVTSFYVNLFAADGPAEGGESVAAPKGGIAVDDAVAKTGYWTYELRNGADEF